MKTIKSKGYKPLTTGDYDTRLQLEKAVMAMHKRGRYSKEVIAEATGCSQSLVSNIVRFQLGR